MKIIIVTGSRDLPVSQAPIVRAACTGFDTVITGCANGADAFARAAAKSMNLTLTVFRAKDVVAPNFIAALAMRSIAMVRTALALAAKNENEVWICGWPARESNIVRPTKRWISCGSGTWSTLALAAGLGLNVAVYGFGDMIFPVWPAAMWVKSERFPGAFELKMLISQKELF